MSKRNLGSGQKANHWLVAKTAREIAAAFYEDAAKDNAFYKIHPDQKRFVEAYKHNFVGPARGSLAQALTGNTLTDEQKKIIHAALVLDQTIPASFRGGQPTGAVRRALIVGATHDV